MKAEIDIVLPWVDGDDSIWLQEKSRFDTSVGSKSNSIIRYRDWENLQYIFRGIEKNMPWVRKVHFITFGHIPSWLNINHPKLNIVKHEEFIPKKYLPTFSSHVIELNLHRIDELSERFIYFNDDIFILDRLNETDFFVDGLPNDILVEKPITTKITENLFSHILINNNALINKNYIKGQQIKRNIKKHFSFKFKKLLIYNLLLYPFKNYLGFYHPHLAQSFLKSTFIEVWKHEEQYLDMTCKNKFRDRMDVNQYLIREWQLVTGCFNPVNIDKKGNYLDIGNDTTEIIKLIKSKRVKLLCLNDNNEDIEFIDVKFDINNALNSIFNERSTFEIE